ncbi:hypothetical protein GWI33_020734 [Rhynchophorus ferrugineus]|uniref:Uncharacterized protein n=1 Tax=Rhynchophorus ferrugineus TaxID=354439 RepID=A0A834HS00_RHYFE|nr:hypothetical protein GWI33_020734 [Rhynchophorus ferrugineus]
MKNITLFSCSSFSPAEASCSKSAPESTRPWTVNQEAAAARSCASYCEILAEEKASQFPCNGSVSGTVKKSEFNEKTAIIVAGPRCIAGRRRILRPVAASRRLTCTRPLSKDVSGTAARAGNAILPTRNVVSSPRRMGQAWRSYFSLKCPTRTWPTKKLCWADVYMA